MGVRIITNFSESDKKILGKSAILCYNRKHIPEHSYGSGREESATLICPIEVRRFS